MAEGPWEAYQQPQQAPQAGPWERYKAPEAMPVEPLPMDDASRMGRVQQTFREKQAAAKAAEPGFFDKLKQAGQAGVEDLGRSLLGVYKSLDPTQATSALEAGAAPVMAGLISTPPGAASVVAGEATRKAAELSGVDPWLQAAAGTAASIAVPGGAIPRRVIQGAMPRPAAPVAKPIQEIMPQTAPAPAPRLALPEPANMVMEAGPEGITRVPPRNIVDLVDEIKKDVKTQVIDDIFEELRTGRTAAMPRREAPLQIGQGRRAEAGPQPPIVAFRKEATDIERALPPVQEGNVRLWRGNRPGELGATAFTDDLPGIAMPFRKGYGGQLSYVDVPASDIPKYANPQRGPGEFNLPGELAKQAQPAVKAIELPPPERPKIIMGKQGYRGAPEPTPMREPGPAVAPPEFVRRTEAPTIQDLLAKSQAKADKSIEKLGIGQRKQPVHKAELPEDVSQPMAEPPFEILPEIQKETPQVAPQATFTKQAIPEAGPAPKPTPWYSTLDEPTREKVFGEMRAIDTQAQSASAREMQLRAPGGTKAVGAADFDEFIKAESRNEFLRNLRKGATPEEAETQAKQYIREAVAKHNAQRKDINWQRADMMGDSYIESARRQVERAVQPETPDLRLETPPTPKRTPLDILKEETGALRMPGKPPPLPGEQRPVSQTRLTLGGLGEESTKTLSRTMGPEGEELGRLAKAVRNEAEIEAHTAQTAVSPLLKGLNPKQLDNLVDVLEGKAKPIDAQVKQAFTTARAELDKVAARASEVGLEIKNPITGEKTPFQPRGNYFPHMFGKELGDVVRDPYAKAQIKASIKEQMESSGQGALKGVTDKQVEQALNAMLKATRGREGHLEIARVFNLPGYSRDPKTVLTKHFQDAYKRINIAEKFGPDLAKGEELLTAIGGEKGDLAEGFARTYLERATGTEKVNRLAQGAVTTAVNVNNFTKLGQAAIANASQPAYTAVVAGAKNAAKGYGAAATKEGREFASKILGDSAREFYEDVAAQGKGVSGKAADAVLRYTGFNFVERLNRTVAANAGKYFAQDTFEKLLANPTNKKARDTLAKMNVDVDAALKRGALNEADELRAGQNIVNRTQFKTDVTELPLFWSSQPGRLLTQYKRFQFKSGQLVKDEIIKEAAKGNVMPLVRAAAILPVAGAAVVTAKDAIRWGPQSERSRGLADYLGAVGTFGAFADAFTGYGRQPVKGLSWLAGPTLGTAGGALDASRALLMEGDIKPAGKMIAGTVPVAGPSLRQLFVKPKSPRQQLLEDLGLSKMLKENRAARKELKEQLGLD